MNEPQHPVTPGTGSDAVLDKGVPAGDHPLEIAAREGFGPLSPAGGEVWHGQATPCVSCGQLVRRDARRCDHCEQDLAPRMIEKMRAHAGPWFVYEHLRPFPGVSLERIIRQIRRGLITETSIIRGPATDFQWRFAVETPGVCRYFGKCWSCQNQVAPSDTYCPHCLTYLTFEKPRAVTPAAAGGDSEGPAAAPSVPPRHFQGEAERGERAAPAEKPSPEHGNGGGPVAPTHTPQGKVQDLEMLRAALEQAPVGTHDAGRDDSPRVFGIRAMWIAVGLLLAAVLVLLIFTQQRSRRIDAPRPAAASPTQVLSDDGA